MTGEDFETMLAVGGKTNSLGKTDEVIREVLNDSTRLEELYNCMFNSDAWVRMRAADAFEKICRVQPEWIEPYIDRMQAGLSDVGQQASIQWHLAQIYQQARLTDIQRRQAIEWLGRVLASPRVDWIVAANAMKTLVYFFEQGEVARDETLRLLTVQTRHASSAVVKKAQRFIDTIE